MNFEKNGFMKEKKNARNWIRKFLLWKKAAKLLIKKKKRKKNSYA